MAEGIGRIKVRIPQSISKGEVISIKALITHPMDTGLIKDKKTGQIIPAHYINAVDVYYGGTHITHCDWTYAVSTNPFMAFYIKADKAAPLKIVYKDNKGGVWEETVQINPK